MSAMESAEPMWPTPARMDCSRTIRRIPCANARTSLESRCAEAVPFSEGSTVSSVLSQLEHDVSEPSALYLSQLERARRGARTIVRRNSRRTEVRSRIGSSWANDSSGPTHELVSVRTTVPCGSLSAAAITRLSAGSPIRPSWFALTIGRAFPRRAARSTAVRRSARTRTTGDLPPGVECSSDEPGSFGDPGVDRGVREKGADPGGGCHGRPHRLRERRAPEPAARGVRIRRDHGGDDERYGVQPRPTYTRRACGSSAATRSSTSRRPRRLPESRRDAGSKALSGREST